MEMIFALILGLNVYDYIIKGVMDTKKNELVDIVDVRTKSIDKKYSKIIAKDVSSSYYSNGVLQDSDVKWVLEDF
mgnify:CR=1 FL=1